MLCSLFSVVGVIAVDTRPFDRNDPAYTPNMARLERELQKTVKEQEKHRETEALAQKKLLQTEDGKEYESVNSNWHACIRENGINSSICEEFHKAQEVALARLQENTDYKEAYLPAITKRDYYANKVNALARAREFATFQSKRFGSEKEAMFAGVDSMEHINGKPSTSFLDLTTDFDRTQDEVREELRGLIGGWISEEYEAAINKVERLMNN